MTEKKTHAEEMVERRQRQRARVPDNAAELFGKLNARRFKQGLKLLKPPVERYPGWLLRAIRGRKTTFSGELQR